jgi:hypothetical protein
VKKRVIVCEPYENPSRHPIEKKIIKMLDHDGVNDADEWMSKEDLVKFYEKFKPLRIDEIDHSVMAVFEKNKKKKTGRKGKGKSSG